tara:strand:- start:313 stop:762 length:450 start_codon:yes stop_codon:yes gene_type:complete
MIMNKFISIDPGKEKCGILLADETNLFVIEGKVVDSKSVLKLIQKWKEKYQIKLILLGNGTTSKFWEDEISSICSVKINFVEEENTTLRAKDRYLELWPRKDLSRFIPKGLYIPAENLDAVAALILLEDYLKKRFNWPVKDDFKIWHEY